MPARYSVCLLGCGPRGDEHLHGISANSERFEIRAICDKDHGRAKALAAKYGVPRTYADGEEMLAKEKPEVFCFVTMPDLRLPLVQLGIQHGVRAIAFEKPMALSLREARDIHDACEAAGVEWVVSHQQKYGAHYRKIKELAGTGEIGRVHTIHATSEAWLTQLGTHMIDYAIWLNGDARPTGIIGQAHGAGRFADSHPSPDHVCGFLEFENGVHGILEFGPLAPSFLEDPNLFWLNDSLTAYGTHGYARMILGKGWEAFTKSSNGKVISGPGTFNPLEEQPLFMRDLADCLDDDAREHPCCGRLAYRGFEAAMGLCLSSLERRHVSLPIDPIPETPLFKQLKPLLIDTTATMKRI